MAAKNTKITIRLHLVAERVPFEVFVPGGQSRNFWIHPRKNTDAKFSKLIKATGINKTFQSSKVQQAYTKKTNLLSLSPLFCGSETWAIISP
jgi:hypothetical protein